MTVYQGIGVRFPYGSPNFAGVLLGEDSAFQADEVGSNPTTRSKCPSGGIGRRAGLRSQYRKVCEFESRGGHQSFRGVEKKNLTWLITKRSVVQIHPPQPVLFHDSTEVVQLTVNQLVPGSIPGRGASFAWLAQLVERLLYTQNVGGSNPSPGTKVKWRRGRVVDCTRL